MSFIGTVSARRKHVLSPQNWIGPGSWVKKTSFFDCPYELWLTTSGAWQLWLARIPGLTQALHRSTLSHRKACRDATSDLLKQCKNQHLSQSDWTKGREKRVSPAGKIGIWHCAAALFSQIPKKCTDLDLSLLYILILRTYSKFARKNNFLALGVCFPQPCSSASRRFAASRLRLQYYRRTNRFISTTKNSMKCVVNWKLIQVGEGCIVVRLLVELKLFFIEWASLYARRVAN